MFCVVYFILVHTHLHLVFVVLLLIFVIFIYLYGKYLFIINNVYVCGDETKIFRTFV